MSEAQIIELLWENLLERLDSMIEAVSGKRLTYAGLTA